MAKRSSAGARIALWTLGILAGLLFVIIIGIGIYTRIAFGAFYAQAKDEFSIPGNGDGFVCQDLDYYDPANTWLFSGYASDEGPSPLYRRNAMGKCVRFYAKLPNGMIYKGHGSGITSTDDFVFLTYERGYLIFSAADVMSAKEGDYVNAIGNVGLEIDPAFLNIENDVLYLGTFHRAPNYPAPETHYRSTYDGTRNGGVILAYPPDEDGPYGFSSHPTVAYSTPDLVQGVCVLPNEDVVLSRSWGLSSSHICTYSKRLGAVIDNITISGVTIPLYILDSKCLVSEIVAPPMTEGIEYHDGRVYISEESASDKYFFGKLYGAGEVYSIVM